MEENGMDELKRRILAEGQNLGQGILKVDSFLNHQVDTHLIFRIGQELASRFADAGATKVMTAEISGIAPALATAHALNVPVVYARKTRPITMTGPVFVEVAPSHTKGVDAFLMVAAEFLVEHAGATLAGIGAVIEKRFEEGREAFAHLNVPVVSLAIVTDMTGGKIVLE
jgi:xanthine phosphoribosyltransferase